MEVEDFVALGLVGLFIGSFIWRLVKYGGFRGAMYGSRIARLVGMIDLGRSGIQKTKVRVFELEDERIVVEQTATAIFAASMQGLPLAGERVDELIELLRDARGAQSA